MAHCAQLTLATPAARQRYQMQALSQQSFRQQDIAYQVGVGDATISQELSRNRQPGAYQAQAAQHCTGQLHQRQAYELKGLLQEEMLERLQQRFSPEQISGITALEQGQKVLNGTGHPS